ncbi:DUF3795 domain-containing protein [Desulfobacula toluolica]|uniref:Conserved uncharacterized protein n=1 Tax=Desulfobacula toluolica (strain DSM 7467 / Tol2) TaxID=651182 RepID=K0NAV7_DESTT|nr:DUF3795 domain-containing protein [Desulfobacula toluolica]CCK81324.1 conserved uncharacterized protein [Desulfobacula toluolica Tol2]
MGFNYRLHFYLALENKEARAVVEKMSEEYNVPVEIMLCKGCRNHDGKIPLQKYIFGDSHSCAAYECSKNKGLDFCGDCNEFPCDNLHPYADRATELPHNMKVFNLCLINKMGLENWAKSKASEVRETYFTKPWTLSDK